MPSTARFSRTSMKTREASTSTPAPPATTSAIPEAGAPARPFAITTRVATEAATTAMTVAAAELVVRRVQLAPNPSVIRHGAAPSSAAATTGISCPATPRWPPSTRWPTASASPTAMATRDR